MPVPVDVRPDTVGLKIELCRPDTHSICAGPRLTAECRFLSVAVRRALSNLSTVIYTINMGIHAWSLKYPICNNPYIDCLTGRYRNRFAVFVRDNNIVIR